MRVPTPSLEEARKRLREEDTGLLLRGVRFGLTIIAVLAGALVGADLFRGGEKYPSLFLLLFTQLLVATVTIRVLRRPGSHRWIVPVVIGVVTVLYFSLLGLDLVLGGSPLTALLFCAVAVGSVALLPWGYRPQLASVSAASLALLLNVWIVTSGELSKGYLVANVAAIGLVLVASVLIAARTQRDREHRMLEHLKLEAAETKLLQLGEELEERVAERTAELEETNRELENFSHTLSHDLRGPLRTVAGFTQTLLEDYGDQLDREGLDYVERVRNASARMGELIDGLLALAHKDREIRREHLDLSTIASQLVEELAATQPDRRVRVAISPGLEADADPQMVRVALANLLGNAWKYTRYEAEPSVEFSSFERAGQRVFYLHDNGIGFDSKEASQMFLPFNRLETEKFFEGSGLGLSTVARIIQRHGGHVWAEGEPGAGATFYFSFGAS